MADTSYAAVLARKNGIMKASLGIDYGAYETGGLAFDYERMMADTGHSLEDIARIQAGTKVGNTPLHELTRLTEQVRATAAPGKGARKMKKKGPRQNRALPYCYTMPVRRRLPVHVLPDRR